MFAVLFAVQQTLSDPKQGCADRKLESDEAETQHEVRTNNLQQNRGDNALRPDARFIVCQRHCNLPVQTHKMYVIECDEADAVNKGNRQM